MVFDRGYDRIEAFVRTGLDAGSDEVSLLEKALCIEESFGLVLSDDEICEKNLGDGNAVKAFLIQKLNQEPICAESAES
jgi:hypothetical protein